MRRARSRSPGRWCGGAGGGVGQALPFGRETGRSDRPPPRPPPALRRPPVAARLPRPVRSRTRYRACACRLDPAAAVAVVRRPRRVALAFRLVLRRQFEEGIQGADGVVDPGARVADRGKPRRHRGDRRTPRPRRSAPRPTTWASRPARRAAATPNTPMLRCGPWRSGCSRGTRSALLLPPLGRRLARHSPLDVAGESQRGTPHLGVRPAALDAHVDVDA